MAAMTSAGLSIEQRQQIIKALLADRRSKRPSAANSSRLSASGSELDDEERRQRVERLLRERKLNAVAEGDDKHSIQCLWRMAPRACTGTQSTGPQHGAAIQLYLSGLTLSKHPSKL